MALYSVRSERAFCEELEYNLLYYGFLGMDLMERGLNATVFTQNRQRLLAHDAGRALFDEMVWVADAEGLLLDEHFSVDGTLLEAAASLGASGPRRDRRHRLHPPQDPEIMLGYFWDRKLDLMLPLPASAGSLSPPMSNLFTD